MKITINPKPITKENFSKFGDMITTADIKPIEINEGYDWLILNPINGEKIEKIEISTHHFKGNFPSQCSLQAAYVANKKSPPSIVKNSAKWKFLLHKVNLSGNKTHIFKNKLMKNDKINFVKINIFPDGGISRFKIFGKAI